MKHYYYKNPLKDKPDYRDAHLSKIDQPPEIVKKICDWVFNPSGMLIFCGTQGIGKTYLCSAIMNYFVEKQEIPFRYWEERQLLGELRRAIRDGQDPEQVLKYSIDEYCIFLNDFASSENYTDWQEDQFFYLIDERYMSRLPTVITTNLYLEDMKKRFHPRLVSRLTDKKNIFIECNGFDKRLKEYES